MFFQFSFRSQRPENTATARWLYLSSTLQQRLKGRLVLLQYYHPLESTQLQTTILTLPRSSRPPARFRVSKFHVKSNADLSLLDFRVLRVTSSDVVLHH